MSLLDLEQVLFEEISLMIEQSRRAIYSRANSETVLLFWKIGRRINNEILNNKRADYGKQIVVTLSRQLAKAYGRSFEEKNLRRMLQYMTCFRQSLSFSNLITRKNSLSWSVIRHMPFSTTLSNSFLDLRSDLISRSYPRRRSICSDKAINSSGFTYLERTRFPSRHCRYKYFRPFINFSRIEPLGNSAASAS